MDGDEPTDAPVATTGMKGRISLPQSVAKLIPWLVLLTVLAAWRGIIVDCDEAFNYWEPLHAMLYGYGFKTWEYAAPFALRSYAYLLPFYAIVRLLVLLSVSNKLLLFKTLRLLLALFALGCHARLAAAIAAAPQGGGRRVARIFLLLMAVLPGNMQAGISLLPNSLSMALTSLLWAHYLGGADNRVFLLALANGLLGWSYSAISMIVPLLTTMRSELSFRAGATCPTHQVPLAARIDMLLRRWVVGGTFGLFYLVAPMLLIDRVFYHRWVLAPLNAIIYNLFSSSGGAHLFGREPASFYLANLFLNLNLVLPLALLAYPLALALGGCNDLLGRRLWGIAVFTVAIFSLQAHKEERFLYHIYPLLTLLAAKTLALPAIPRSLSRCLLALVVILSISRSLAVIRNYGAADAVFSQLDRLVPRQDGANVCLGRDWHRFPTHFYLQGRHGQEQRVFFVQSTFAGMLPLFQPSSSAGHEELYNARNEASPTQFSDPSLCRLFVGSPAEADTIWPSRDKIILHSAHLVEPRGRRGLGLWQLARRLFYIPLCPPDAGSYRNFALIQLGPVSQLHERCWDGV